MYPVLREVRKLKSKPKQVTALIGVGAIAVGWLILHSGIVVALGIFALVVAFFMPRQVA